MKYTRKRSAATSYSMPTTSTRRSSLPRRSRRPAWAALSRFARWWSRSDPRANLPRAVGTRSRCPDRQEAFAIAAERWPREGVPANPGNWLITTARNRAIDRVRRDRTLTTKTRLLQVPEAAEDRMNEASFPDERLELIFTCCHPALATNAQVALTLRTVGGLTTGDIARAFLVPEPTMAQRLVRAKRKIKAAGICAASSIAASRSSASNRR